MADPSSWTAEDITYLRDRGRLPADVPADQPQPEDQTAAAIDSNDEPEDHHSTAPAYHLLTNNSLRKLLRDRGLPTVGAKDELVNRLEEDDSQIIMED
jgi:hypothetical protein